MNTMTEWLSDPSCMSNATLQLMGATMCMHDESYEQALKCCQSAANLEQ